MKLDADDIFALVFAAILVVVGGILWAVLRNKDNEISCWQFISSRGPDGKHYADIDKLGKCAGIFISSWVVVKYAYSGKLEWMLFSAYLAYVGAVGGYSAYLRMRQSTSTAQK